MHHCLQIAEILNNIFESYCDDDKQTLLRLALVCKIFLDPALDALWKFQQSFLTLVETLPGDLWQVNRVSDRLFQLSFKRPSSFNWDRFQFYAKRMKTLQFQERAIMHRAVFRMIDYFGHCHRPLLQNLSKLTCDYKVSLEIACMFLGPRLAELELFLSPVYLSDTSTLSFLAAVKSGCPLLKKITINSYTTLHTIYSTILDLVCDLTSLQTIILSPFMLSHEVLVRLASLPNLRALQASLPNTLPLPISQEVVPFPFPALIFFSPYVKSITDVSQFLQLTSSSPGLESLHICTDTSPSSQELHTFFTTVKKSGSRLTLTTISLCDYEEFPDHEDIPPSHSLEAHALVPLFQCPNLEDISILLCSTQETIDNAVMKDMALAWPRLRRIALHSNLRSRWHSDVNLEGLLHLAQHCRVLEAVTHKFDVSLPTVLEERPGNGICNESMTLLSVGRSLITNPHVVASFLTEVFPNAVIRDHWDHDGEELSEDPEFMVMHRLWEEVHDFLDTFSTSRKQESAC